MSTQALTPTDRAAPDAATGIDAIVTGLRRARDGWRQRQDAGRDVERFPSRAGVEDVVALIAAALYPRRLGHFRGAGVEEDRFVAAKLLAGLTALEREIGAELAYWQKDADAAFPPEQAALIARLFGATLPKVRDLIDSDVEAAFLADPAARSVDEILLCYPGATASLHHRIAHELNELGAPIVARMISELANERTGIDIHPGATIGRHFFIDHGTGVVIGETAIIGERVRLYQHVTLGARSALGTAPRSPRDRFARHPIVEDDVIVYAGATILGRVTIGARSVIGGNVWLLADAAPDSVLVQPEAQALAIAEGRALRQELEGRA
ncbi:serine O-acetyltransferase [Sphingomonas sp. SORGH_AS 950]|uniref:serine O-acetyltransferase EpsC n=1 Tax=unclassified Sphingomonas TaxID=196159 RepID=UPI00278858A9|nr:MULTISPECIES: serine O-acetyltransferase EpsC [unclassified Sphingomonas]MDQ1159133.1 serine O-acetyltransferase [Sphingomonas sp. SORGH_AS_0950]MDR6113223.1 serine O-acetyltransferase [Sphingomonas sp. SORGH_AS_0789]MDR6145663.1 serine O-acetyltransferase [Sphingomonas sp. SORGH_AS_0870]MDR6149416.1 serine O-acetyltransferase [Sphingomonas sp. SORGH_AS_0742]